MSTESKKKPVKKNSYESLQALFFSGKVKPSLNKIIVELESDPENLAFTHLALQCLLRTKNYEDLATYADVYIKLDPENIDGYFYKGMAFQNIKGKEQDAIKSFNEALLIDPDNTICLKNKAATHLLLFANYNLPLQFAEKHKAKAQACLTKVMELIEAKEQPTYMEYLIISDVNIMVSQNLNAKKYYIKAVNAFNDADEAVPNMNIYNDIIKAQKACVKLVDKFTEF